MFQIQFVSVGMRWKDKINDVRTMPCEHTPDSSGYPTERLFDNFIFGIYRIKAGEE